MLEHYQGNQAGRSACQKTYDCALTLIVNQTSRYRVVWEQNLRHALRDRGPHVSPTTWAQVPRLVNRLIASGLAKRLTTESGNQFLQLLDFDGRIEKLRLKHEAKASPPVSKGKQQVSFCSTIPGAYEDAISASNYWDQEVDAKLSSPGFFESSECSFLIFSKNTQNLRATSQAGASPGTVQLAKQGLVPATKPVAVVASRAPDRPHPTQAAFETTPKAKDTPRPLADSLKKLERLGILPKGSKLAETLVTRCYEPDRFDYVASVSEADSRGYARATAEAKRVATEKAWRKDPRRHPPMARHATVSGLEHVLGSRLRV